MTHKYQIRKLCTTILLFLTRQPLKSVGVGRKSGDGYARRRHRTTK
ncbi:hypothetical protein [Nostoc sp.]